MLVIKKKWLKRTIATLIFVIGLGIISFPFVSNAMSQQQQYRMIDTYNSVSRHSKQAVVVSTSQINKTLSWFKNPFQQFNVKKVDEDKKSNTINGMLTQVEMLGTINIPGIDAKLPIFKGTDDLQLSEGTGLMEKTSPLDGKKGSHSVVTAHRGLPGSKLFTDLPKLKKGDRFFINSKGKKMTYKVDRIKTITPDELGNFAKDDKYNYVTLMTCTPYMINSHRLLVRGHRIPNEKEPAPKQQIPWIWIGLGVVVAGGAAYGGYRWYKKRRSGYVKKH
ncbi:Sortase A, LPXTG specific [Pediococcus damnosus]|uniref:class C sortase n=1 Tax=Pediococcus damnosus TaxID=51663 RepID=UPI00078C5196|nr:class C sortase [Pediococcus damnosus]AMV60659.1 Sortase A, LPXTG specific [Pediococcus damnosus]AMV64974.1 Sortase A, LPXTG specific [Pediococcus damnosus]